MTAETVWRSQAVLQAAQKCRDKMVLEGSPNWVVRAADALLQAYRDGAPCPEWAACRLRDYSAQRQQQNRYGQ